MGQIQPAEPLHPTSRALPQVGRLVSREQWKLHWSLELQWNAPSGQLQSHLPYCLFNRIRLGNTPTPNPHQISSHSPLPTCISRFQLFYPAPPHNASRLGLGCSSLSFPTPCTHIWIGAALPHPMYLDQD